MNCGEPTSAEGVVSVEDALVRVGCLLPPTSPTRRPAHPRRVSRSAGCLSHTVGMRLPGGTGGRCVLQLLDPTPCPHRGLLA
jgi:hypothetical protein